MTGVRAIRMRLGAPDQSGRQTPEEIAGAKEVLQNGGEVRVLAFRDGHSSSRIIDRLRDE